LAKQWGFYIAEGEMISASVVLAVLSLLTGAAAAWFWFESSQSLSRSVNAVPGEPAGALSLSASVVWAMKNHRAAALLSGASVLVGSLSNLLGLFSRMS
jgi:homospermidine synthase